MRFSQQQSVEEMPNNLELLFNKIQKKKEELSNSVDVIEESNPIVCLTAEEDES